MADKTSDVWGEPWSHDDINRDDFGVGLLERQGCVFNLPHGAIATKIEPPTVRVVGDVVDSVKVNIHYDI